MVSIQEAIQYIKYYRQQGYQDNALYQGLLGQGYPQDMVGQAFQYLNQQKQAQPQSDQQSSRQSIGTTEDHKQFEKKTKLIFIIIAAAVLLIGGIVLAALMNMSNGGESVKITDTAKTTTTTEKELYTQTTQSVTTTTIRRRPNMDPEEEADQEEINYRYKMNFCDFIDTSGDFICYKNPYDEFERGYTVYIYFKPTFEAVERNGEYKIGFTQNREVTDPDGNIVYEMSEDYVIDKEFTVEAPGEYQIASSNSIETNESLPLGIYTVKIEIVDMFGDRNAELIKEFELV